MPHKPIHKLPASDQLNSEGDHIQIDRVVIMADSRIKVEGTPGTLDENDDFVEHPYARKMIGWVRDREGFEQEATDHPTPAKKKDPLDHGMADILDHIDTNNNWEVR